MRAVRAMLRYVLEALAILLVGSAIGLLVNAVRADGLDLGALPRAPEPPAYREDPELAAMRVALDEVRALSADPTKGLVVDARGRERFDRGHIPNARWLSEEHFHDPDWGWRRFEGYKDKRVVVYCDSASCGDSRAVAERLKQVGFRDVGIFVGGWEAWRRNDLPVQRSRP